MMIRNIFVLAIIATLIPGVYMVKQEDFKTCSQSGFCARQRAYADIVDLEQIPSPYIFNKILKVDESQGEVVGEIENTSENVKFTFSINVLYPDALRLRMLETNPLYPRYAPPHGFSIDSNTPTGWISQQESSDESQVVFLYGGHNNRLVIQKSPFNLWIENSSNNNDVLFNLNDRGYLHYEHYREKPAATVEGSDDQNKQEEEEEAKNNDDDGPLQELKKKLKEGMFEETFNKHKDSKPKGPGSIGIDFTLPGFEHVYGLPEHAAPFNLPSTRGEGKTYEEPYRLYNFDVFEYILDSPMALYGSIPYMIGHKQGSTVGVYWNNYGEMWVDVERNQKSTQAHWSAETGILDLIILSGSKPSDVSKQFSRLTGRPTMPQQFAIAYHQCRWNYNDENDVADVNAGFEEHDIPYDVLWLDIEHTDSKKYFTWDSRKFPNPVEMQNNLAQYGRKMVTIIDPHIKKDNNYYISKEITERGILVKNSDKKDYEGWCWPGNSQYIDFTNPKAREYWSEQFIFSNYKGSTKTLYTWNDMNEPSVFSGPEVTMQKDNLHFGDWEHRDVHNIYGMLQHRSTYEGHLKRSNNEDRPFILSRAFFAGTQRYGAIWTGDNFARWDHMGASVPMLLSIGMSGVVFSGADVGGFFGNPSPELLLRWYQLGAYQPFFRAHAHIDTKRREPWLFGEPFTSLIRKAIRSRYMILPYLYTLNFVANRLGWPIMRPMMFEFPNDVNTFAMDDQYMLGNGLLVKPQVEEKAESVDIYLPDGKWYDYESFEPIFRPANGMVTMQTPIEKIPVLVRGGSIVPRRQRVRRSSTLMKGDPFTLVIALDSNKFAYGTLYNDDGHSYKHEKGEYFHVDFKFETTDGNKSTLKSAPLPPVDGWGTQQADAAYMKNIIGGRVERLIILGLGKTVSSVKVVGDGARVFSYESDQVMVVKDPSVWIGSEWSIQFD